MIFLHDIRVQKECPTIVNVVVRYRIKSLLMDFFVLFLYLVQDNECHVAERQVKVLLLDDPIVILVVKSMTILKRFSVGDLHSKLWFSIASYVAILFKNKRFVFHQQIWKSFFVPNDSIVSVYKLLVKFSVVFYVPSEKDKLI